MINLPPPRSLNGVADEHLRAKLVAFGGRCRSLATALWLDVL